MPKTAKRKTVKAMEAWGVVAHSDITGGPSLYLSHTRSTRKAANLSAAAEDWIWKYRLEPLLILPARCYKIIGDRIVLIRPLSPKPRSKR